MRKTIEIDNEGYLNPIERWNVLAIAVVKQAVCDWKEAERRHRNPNTDNVYASELKREAEKFLRSDLCELYCGCEGRTILRKLREGQI